MSDLRLEDISRAAGEAEEGRTLELELIDDRVIVARIRQIQTGSIECPADGCFRRFDAERPLRTHVGRMHPDMRRRECPTCGDEFLPYPPDQKFCSTECYRRDGRTQMVCEGCGKVFSVKESHEDDRKFCSKDCWAEHAADESKTIVKTCPTCSDEFETYRSNEGTYCSRECWRNRETENIREERTCPECGDAFETYPSEDKQYCSRECFDGSGWETKECPMCGQEFESRKNNRHLSKTYCSRPCHYEYDRQDRRPDEPYALIEEIDGEFDDVENVVARGRAHLGPDWSEQDVRLYRALVVASDYSEAVERVRDDHDASDEELVARVLGLVLEATGTSERVTIAALRQAIAEAESLFDFGQRLDIRRSGANPIVRQLGIKESLGTPEIDEIADALDTAPAGDDSWKQYTSADRARADGGEL